MAESIQPVFHKDEKGQAMLGKRSRRQHTIVNRSLQYRLLAIVLVYALIIVVFLTICLFVPDVLKIMNDNLSLEEQAEAARKTLTLHSRVWPAIVALLCMIGIHSVRVFHRLIGPLYRFRAAYARIGKGDISFRVTLRRKDYLQEEKEAFNAMMDALSKEFGGLQLAALDSLESLNDLESEVGGLKGVDQKLLLKHRENLEALLHHSRYFRISTETAAKRNHDCSVAPVSKGLGVSGKDSASDPNLLSLKAE